LSSLSSNQNREDREVQSNKNPPKNNRKTNKQKEKPEHFKRSTFWHLSWQEDKTWKKYGIATLRPEDMKQLFQKLKNKSSGITSKGNPQQVQIQICSCFTAPIT